MTDLLIYKLRRKRRAAAAATVTFRSFGNQERIQTEKCRALPTVRHYRQPAETCRRTEPTRRSYRPPGCAQIRMARAPRSILPRRRPPGTPTSNHAVGPNICAKPPGPTGLNTGKPMAPHARYSAAAAKPRRLPRVRPINNTPKFARVNGTGVKGRGKDQPGADGDDGAGANHDARLLNQAGRRFGDTCVGM